MGKDDRGVTSVLGVVLMVAVTIILASVIGVYVLGIGSDLTETSPQTSFEFSHSTSPGDTNSTTIVHGGGDTFQADSVEITIGGETVYENGENTSDFLASGWSGEVSSGDSITIKEDAGTFQPGDSVIIIWNGEESSSIIGESTVS